MLTINLSGGLSSLAVITYLTKDGMIAILENQSTTGDRLSSWDEKGANHHCRHWSIDLNIKTALAKRHTAGLRYLDSLPFFHF